MRSAPEPTDAGVKYAAAHVAHYEAKNLRTALELYRDIMAAHAETSEAKYSRAQILNIVSLVVPEQELLDAQIELLVACFEQDGPAKTVHGFSDNICSVIGSTPSV